MRWLRPAGVFVLAGFLLMSGAAGRNDGGPAGRLFIANLRSSDLSVVDVATGVVLARIPLPRNPHELTQSSDGRHVFTALYHSERLAVVDTNGFTVRLVDARGRPHGVSAFGDLVAVTGESSGVVSMIDPELNLTVWVARTAGGLPHAVAVDPGAGRAYATNTRSGTLAVIDLATGEPIASVPVGALPEAVSVGGGFAVTANAGDNTVSLVDVATLEERARIAVEGRPVRAAVSPDGRSVLVASTGESAVAVIDIATRRLTRWIPVGAAPDGIAFSANGRWAFVANGASNDVSVIDMVSFTTIGRLPAGDGPSGLLLVEAGE